MKLIKNKIYIDHEGEGWVLNSIDPINLTRLRYPNFTWIGHPDEVKIQFIPTDIEYTRDFWDKAGLREVQEFWDKHSGKIKKVKRVWDARIN